MGEDWARNTSGWAARGGVRLCLGPQGGRAYVEGREAGSLARRVHQTRPSWLVVDFQGRGARFMVLPTSAGRQG